MQGKPRWTNKRDRETDLVDTTADEALRLSLQNKENHRRDRRRRQIRSIKSDGRGFGWGGNGRILLGFSLGPILLTDPKRFRMTHLISSACWGDKDRSSMQGRQQHVVIASVNNWAFARAPVVCPASREKPTPHTQRSLCTIDSKNTLARYIFYSSLFDAVHSFI